MYAAYQLYCKQNHTNIFKHLFVNCQANILKILLFANNTLHLVFPFHTKKILV